MAGMCLYRQRQEAGICSRMCLKHSCYGRRDRGCVVSSTTAVPALSAVVYSLQFAFATFFHQAYTFVCRLSQLYINTFSSPDTASQLVPYVGTTQRRTPR